MEPVIIPLEVLIPIKVDKAMANSWIINNKKVVELPDGEETLLPGLNYEIRVDSIYTFLFKYFPNSPNLWFVISDIAKRRCKVVCNNYLRAYKQSFAILLNEYTL